jgi:ribosomal-protein-alanine N-acetyltransferase
MINSQKIRKNLLPLKKKAMRRNKERHHLYIKQFKKWHAIRGYQKNTKINLSGNSLAPYLIESFLIRQAIRLQIYRFGMRWNTRDFKDILKSNYIWACGITSANHKFLFRLQGFVFLRVIGEEAEILTIAITNSKQRKGIGKFLLELAVKHLELIGAQSVFLEVSITNRTAIKFYKTNNFINIGKRKNYYAFSDKNKKDALIMCRYIRRRSPRKLVFERR